MKREELLFDAITDVRDDLVEAALSHRFRRAAAWRRWGSLAACLVLLAASAVSLRFLGTGGSKNAADVNTGIFGGAAAGDSAPESSAADDSWFAADDSKAEADSDALVNDALFDGSDAGANGMPADPERGESRVILSAVLEGGGDLAVSRELRLTTGEELLVEDVYFVTAPTPRQIRLRCPVSASLSEGAAARITVNGGEDLADAFLRMEAEGDLGAFADPFSSAEPTEDGTLGLRFWTEATVDLPAGETVEICVSYGKRIPGGEMLAISGDGWPVERVVLNGRETELSPLGEIALPQP